MRWFEICESYLVEDRIDFLRNQFKDIPSNDFNQIVESDPTKNKIYTQWLLKLYKKNQLNDLNNISKYLSVFDRWKHKLDKKDINQYHNIDELINAIDPHDDKTDELRNQYQISDSDFNKISEADPTENKIYVKWLLDIYSKDKRLIEDLPKATRYLKVFDKKKTQIGTDITDYDDLPDLYLAIEPFDKRKDATKQWDGSINKEIKVIYKGPEGSILTPLTKEASIYLGQGTQWCTAFTNDKNEFEYYNDLGPLYCIFTNDGRKYQFHLQDLNYDEYDIDDLDNTQLKNSIDKDVNIKEFNEKYPWVFDKIWPTEEDKIATVTRRGNAIQYIKNPSEEVQLAAVDNYGLAIVHIKNPSEEVQLAAVNQDGWVIEYIKNPSEEVQLAAVNKNGWAIQFIKNPSEEVQLAAVTKIGSAIQFIENPSEEVQLAAVNQNSNAIKYIKNPTPKVIELARSLGYKKKL